jgi:hypothetical protein
MYSTRIVVDIIDCLGHKNLHIRKAADLATELGIFTYVSFKPITAASRYPYSIFDAY